MLLINLPFVQGEIQPTPGDYTECLCMRISSFSVWASMS